LSRLEGRPLDGNFLGEFMPELWSGDSDGETVARTQKGRLDAFRNADKPREEAGEDYALERDSADGVKCNASPIWNPSREQWTVIWVCAMTSWLLWSSDNGVLGYTALFGHNTDQRFGTLATVIGVLRIWQLESRRQT